MTAGCSVAWGAFDLGLGLVNGNGINDNLNPLRTD